MGVVWTPSGKAAPLPSQTLAGFAIFKVWGVSHSITPHGCQVYMKEEGEDTWLPALLRGPALALRMHNHALVA